MTPPDECPRRGSWIDDVAAMAPFLTTVVSGGDRWMFVASTGGLTAGRRDPDGALFAYETDDRLCAADGAVGPRTVLFVERGGQTRRWEPFLRAADGLFAVRRRLWKSTLGDELWFEERNEDLGLTLRYGWRSGAAFGFVRDVELHEHGAGPVAIRVLDGLLGILPAGVDRTLQATHSNLVDAYKQAELLPAAGVALFRLSSIPTDRAVPNEALRANVAWVRGLPAPTLLLSARQLPAFRRGEPVHPEHRVRGVPGSLLAAATLALQPGERARWCTGLDAGLDARAVIALERRLGPGPARTAALAAAIESDRDADRARLLGHVAAADGLQITAAPAADARHAANALFNAMRGGTFVDDGRVDRDDFARYLREVAPRVADRAELDAWPASCTRAELVERAGRSGSVDLERLAREYLPLTFSRRHGDPSRPWNSFSIETDDADGRPRLQYAGNWRDIFQNWEALLCSYPAFAEAAVVKFVNATTEDGHNPYRIGRAGFDWEVPDPRDPWSHIGYWGDHQIVYLQRLLDLCERQHPGALAQLLRRPLFVFADVPYRLAGYRQLLAAPHDTITFDAAQDRAIRALVQTLGNEARLAPAGARGVEPRRAGLGEKLLVPILAKLSAFVPGLGIWMNTQRPEWNDANNALVGRGVSVVTAAQLARHCDTVRRLLAGGGDAPLPVSRAVQQHLRETAAALAGEVDAARARAVLDQLGAAGERYRAQVYARAAAALEPVDLPVAEATALLDRARQWLLATVLGNRRDDGLFHAYNLMVRDGDGGLRARRLPPMLEGQVAALAAGALAPAAAADLLDALAASPLRRQDLGTYLLYPDRPLPSFLDKGRVPDAALAASPLLQRLLQQGHDELLRRAADGSVRFAPALRSHEALVAACDALALPDAERDELAEVYERVFDHAAFTGRSGAFFGFEGLGCVYWHMVSKLRLAALETLVDARRLGAPTAILTRLRRHCDDLRRGLGIELDPARYGAFPTDPYSHTPAHAGARQPGMTGQVKEDLLARRLELGVEVTGGCLEFGSVILGGDEPLTDDWRGQLGGDPACDVPAGAVGFSVCGVPVRLRIGAEASVTVHLREGRAVPLTGTRLEAEWSRDLFERTGRIVRIDVTTRG
ncbi:MAG: hypothetical protein AB7O97_12680 [Planctomycetota bacterium]